MGLNVGGFRRRRSLSIRRRRRHKLHLDAAFVDHKVVDGRIASFEVRLQIKALGKQRANRMPLLQPDLVVGELSQPCIGLFVRASLNVVERANDPVRRARNRCIEAVSNLKKGLDGKVGRFEAAGSRWAGDRDVKIGVRWR